MKSIFSIRSLFTLTVFCISLCSCKKEEDWLAKKPNKSLVVPVNFTDFQSLLNNEDIFNVTDVSLGFMAVEDYYVTYPVWQARATATERNSYTWEQNIYEGESVIDWNNPYQQTYYCNTILEGLDKMPVESKAATDWKQLQGSALFFRAYAFFKLAFTFAAPYDKNTAVTDAGIPLRLDADPNNLQPRASVQQTYDRIITDLKQAEELLPVTVSIKSKPSKAAARALLARIYLSMEDYDNALLYAESSLLLNNTLLDYNSLNATAPFPFALFNAEDIFHTRQIAYGIFNITRAFVDTTLYRSYQTNDLRRTLYFSGSGSTIAFKGSYEGSAAYYSGPATDELYLTRAECNARKGNTITALNDLNVLLQKRWKTGTFIPFTAATSADALAIILTERRKELVFRGTRWLDLRRLNKDTRFAVSLTRVLNGKTYTLPPNSQLYVLPIPDNEIRLSGIQQNPR